MQAHVEFVVPCGIFYFLFSVFLFIYLEIPKTNRARGIWAFAELASRRQFETR
jgi:hypothetical protein